MISLPSSVTYVGLGDFKFLTRFRGHPIDITLTMRAKWSDDLDDSETATFRQMANKYVLQLRQSLKNVNGAVLVSARVIRFTRTARRRRSSDGKEQLGVDCQEKDIYRIHKCHWQ